MRTNRGGTKKDCSFKDRKSTFKCMKCNIYLCIGKEGSNFLFLLSFKVAILTLDLQNKH